MGSCFQRIDFGVARHIQEDVDLQARVRRGRIAGRQQKNILGSVAALLVFYETPCVLSSGADLRPYRDCRRNHGQKHENENVSAVTLIANGFTKCSQRVVQRRPLVVDRRSISSKSAMKFRAIMIYRFSWHGQEALPLPEDFSSRRTKILEFKNVIVCNMGSWSLAIWCDERNDFLRMVNEI